MAQLGFVVPGRFVFSQVFPELLNELMDDFRGGQSGRNQGFLLDELTVENIVARKGGKSGKG
jgi:hypothetical protein